MGGLLLLLVVASSLWVLCDAKTLGIQKGQLSGFADMGPWGWFFASLLIWIIAFPLYLAKRGEYKRMLADPTRRSAVS